MNDPEVWGEVMPAEAQEQLAGEGKRGTTTRRVKRRTCDHPRLERLVLDTGIAVNYCPDCGRIL